MSIKTLLVDDERSLLEQAEIFLERESEEIEVLTVSSAEETQDVIDSEDIDVIVSDYQMPDMNGLDFLEEVRNERDDGIPFIMFTGKGREEVAIKALNLGADRYIQKGGDPKSQYGVLADAITQEYESHKSKKKLEESKEELRESRKKYKKIFEESPLGVLHYDEVGVIIECNDKFVDIIGSSRDELIGFDMLEDLENDELMEEVRSSLGDGEGYYEGEYTSITAGETSIVRVFFKGIENEHGEISSGIALVEDISERKEHEQELRRKETYLDHTPAFINVIDENGKIKYHSYPSKEIVGLDPSKFMGEEGIEFVHPDDREKTLEMFSKVLENPGEECRAELRGKVEDGWIWLEVRAVNHLDDPEINGIIVTAQDISERKEMENKLEEKNRFLQNLLNNTPGTVFRCLNDEHYTMKFLSEGCKELIGYEPEELIDNKKVSYADLIMEEDKEKVREKTEAVTDEGDRYRVTYRIKSADGEVKWVWELGKVIESHGNDQYLEGIITDITERKEMEEEIKYRENLERIITEVSTGLMNIEVEKIHESINQALGKIAEFADADRSYVFQFYEDLKKMDMTHEWCAEGVEPQKENMQNFSTDDLPWLMEKVEEFENITVPRVSDLPFEAEAFEEILKEQNIQSLLVLPIVYDNELEGLIGFDWVSEEERWSEEVVDLLRIAGEAIQSALNRKEAEQRLKEREVKYRTIFESANDAILIIKENKYIDCNEKALELFECDRGDMIGEAPFSFSPEKQPDGKDSRERAKEKINSALEGESQEFYWVHATKDGEPIPTDVTLNRYTIDHETFVLAVVRDITDRKEKEHRLRKERKKFRKIFNNANDAVYLHELTDEGLLGRFVEVNDTAVEMLGYSRDEFLEMTPEDIDVGIMDDELSDVLDELQEKGEMKFEMIHQAKDGTEIPVEIKSHIFELEGEKRVLSIARDITDRKKAEERIEENKDKLERLHEISAELQACQSEEEVYSFAVQAAEDILEFDICGFDAVEGDMFVTKGISSGTPEDGHTERRVDEGGLDRKTYLNQESYLVDDLFADKDAKPVDDDYRSAISVPVGDDGIFQAVSKEPGHFDEEDLRMVELLASHVSEALQRIQVKEREEFLHSLLRHDVGNKAQIIQGYLDLMKDADSSEESETYRTKAKNSLNEAQKIIEKIRKLRKIDEEDESSETDLNTVIDRVGLENMAQLKDEGIKIDISGCDCRVKGGPLLEELFSNLIENSIRHSNCDRVRVSSQAEEDECVVTVEDDGKGIADEAKDKVFEKGFKAGENGGTGLGLYMAKEIARSYGGKVEVGDSEMGGARFDVHLKK